MAAGKPGGADRGETVAGLDVDPAGETVQQAMRHRFRQQWRHEIGKTGGDAARHVGLGRDVEAEADHDGGKMPLGVRGAVEQDAGQFATVQHQVVGPFQTQHARIRQHPGHRIGQRHRRKQRPQAALGQTAPRTQQNRDMEIARRGVPGAAETPPALLLPPRHHREAGRLPLGRALAHQIGGRGEGVVDREAPHFQGDAARKRKGSASFLKKRSKKLLSVWGAGISGRGLWRRLRQRQPPEPGRRRTAW